jgi:hypothetical protein
MPRIRDLGINAIPATMRPPEVGRGGFFAGPNCGGASGGTEGCHDGTCEDDEKSPPSPCGGASFGGTATCPDGTCEPSPRGPDRKKDQADRQLDAAAADQLRRHLAQQIASTPQI